MWQRVPVSSRMCRPSTETLAEHVRIQQVGFLVLIASTTQNSAATRTGSGHSITTKDEPTKEDIHRLWRLQGGEQNEHIVLFQKQLPRQRNITFNVRKEVRTPVGKT